MDDPCYPPQIWRKLEAGQRAVNMEEAGPDLSRDTVYLAGECV